jgi:hypothetical protein
MLAAATAALALSGAVQAQTAIDLNLGYTRFDDAGADAVTGRIGARLVSFVGAEGEVSVGVDDALDTAWGVFAKGVLPNGETAELFARAGFADAQIAGPGDGDGLAFGAGGQVMAFGRNGVRFDYTRYEFGGDVDAYSISYVLRLN